MDLAIVEPPVPVEEDPPVKRALVYPIQIMVTPAAAPTVSGAPLPPPPMGGDHDQGGRRRRRRRSSSRSSMEWKIPCA